jgi:hypothetical protein
VESFDPEPAKVACCVRASSKVLIFDFPPETQTRTPLLTLPMYRTAFGSNSFLILGSSSGPITAPGMMLAMTVPSLGATLDRKPAAIALPAPGMFFGTMFGLPGMWRAMCRATARP